MSLEPVFEVQSNAEIESAIEIVKRNADEASSALKELSSDGLSALAQIKFFQIGKHPLKSHPLNLIEQINQTFTYLVALEAARLLLGWHPESDGFRLAPGAHAPKGSLDIESRCHKLVGAETFAAVRPGNNQKLAKDLAKLANRDEQHLYSFFMSPEYPTTKRIMEKEKRDIQVWSIAMPTELPNRPVI